MGQILLEDKIGTLSHSSGVISLTASRLTIGGQQYNTSALSRTISADVTMVANTRYQIFAVVSGGTVSLRISANENSTGPSGFSVWKLVGAFYANGVTGSIALGNFVNIDGAQIVEWVSYTPTIVNGAGTITGTISGNWRRVGDSAEIQIQYNYTSGTGAAADFAISLPSGLVADIIKSPSGGLYGSGHYYSSVTGFKGTEVRAATTTSLKFTKDSGAWIRITDVDDAGTVIAAVVLVPIAGWSITPIKDL